MGEWIRPISLQTIQGGDGHNTIIDWNKKQEPYVVDMVRYQAWKWEYTKKGYLFYERYIPDGMEADGTVGIRVLPLDEELRKLCEDYIEPIGYEANNLFLVEWDEENFQQVNFNDLYDILYRIDQGSLPDSTQYPNGIGRSEFEDLIGKYFSIPAEQLREQAGYNSQTGHISLDTDRRQQRCCMGGERP